MKKTNLYFEGTMNLEGIDLNAKCANGKTLAEWLEGISLEDALWNEARYFQDAIEEGIADSLMYDERYAPEWFKAQMQNIDIILPNKEIRDYVVSLVKE